MNTLNSAAGSIDMPPISTKVSTTWRSRRAGMPIDRKLQACPFFNRDAKSVGTAASKGIRLETPKFSVPAVIRRRPKKIGMEKTTYRT